MSLREIRFYVDFFPAGGSRNNSEKRVMVLLEANVLINQFFLDEHPDTPSIYQFYKEGKIKYKLPAQMDGGEVHCETFRDIPQIIENGGGDCDNIASWRAAELRHKGIAAKPYITKRPRAGGGTIYHVIVKWPDGSSEDPCLLMDMAPDRVDEIANEQRKQQERLAEGVLGALMTRPDRAQLEAQQAELMGVMDWFLKAQGE